jgi:hypothetical protein
LRQRETLGRKFVGIGGQNPLRHSQGQSGNFNPLLRFVHSTPPGLWSEEPIPLPLHPLNHLFNRAI